MKLLEADPNAEWRARYAHRQRIIVTDDTTCQKALNRLDRALAAGTPGFGFDCETDTVNRVEVQPVTIQVSYDDTDILFGPDHVRALKPWIKAKPTMFGFESKFELWAMENCGMKWEGDVHDAQITDYLINENVKDYDLKTRCATISGLPKRPDWKELFKARKSSDIWNSRERNLFIDYSLADSADHLWLHENRREELRKWPLRPDTDTNMYDHFYLKSEVPLTKVLYDMERVGALIDVDYLKELHEIAETTIEKIQRKFYAEIDFANLPKKTKKAIKGDFSGYSDKLMNSPQQLVELFYNTLGYPQQYHMVKGRDGRKTKKVTTNDTALDALAAMGYKPPALLQENREVAKLDSTYLVGLVEHADFEHYVHTNFMQAFTTTGRLSSRDPNLQNIPRPDSAEGAPDYMRDIRLGIRGAFIAPPGFVIVGGDYGQIETRLMAHLSGDQDMIRACMESDIYSAMAAILFHKSKEFFTKDAAGKWLHKEAGRIRQIVKAIVLGIGFGKQAKSIARDLSITEKEAEGFLKQYFLRFPVFYAWMRKQIRKARRTGFVRTITGRYRRLPDLRLPNTRDNWWRISSAERMALNSPVQGSAYEIMKQSMLNMASSGVLEKFGASMFLTVHDELLNYVPVEEAPAFAKEFREIMMHPFEKDFKVPLEVATYTALNWAEGK